MQDVTLEETALAEVSLLFFPPSVVAVASLIHENRKKDALQLKKWTAVKIKLRRGGIRMGKAKDDFFFK